MTLPADGCTLGDMPCSRRPMCNCQSCQADRSSPSPAEIRQACRQIQAGWTPRERLNRSGVLAVDDVSYRVPVVSTADVPEWVEW